MSGKWLVVSVAGLGWDDVEKRKLKRMCGLDFAPASTVFPAVTCTVQASFRTASEPRLHGMTSNGVFIRDLHKAAFWEQSASLVQGPRIWDAARAAGRSVGMMFWQQSLGEAADVIVSPAPIHKHGGGMIMENYTKPAALAKTLSKHCGTFPLGRYWTRIYLSFVGVVILYRIIGFHAYGVYRIALRHTSVRDAITIGISIAVSTAFLMATAVAIRDPKLPGSVCVISGLLDFIFLVIYYFIQFKTIKLIKNLAIYWSLFYAQFF